MNAPTANSPVHTLGRIEARHSRWPASPDGIFGKDSMIFRDA
jgi:hypothetical protein